MNKATYVGYPTGHAKFWVHSIAALSFTFPRERGLTMRIIFSFTLLFCLFASMPFSAANAEDWTWKFEKKIRTLDEIEALLGRPSIQNPPEIESPLSGGNQDSAHDKQVPVITDGWRFEVKWILPPKGSPFYRMIKLFAESAGYGTVENDDMGYPPSGR
jgi:hypothetical protein